MTETRTRTDWTSVSGTVSFFHDDVLVPGSNSSYAGGGSNAGAAEVQRALIGQAGIVGNMIASKFSSSLRTWNTKELVPYQEEYIR